MPTNIGKLSVILSAQTSKFAKKMRGATGSVTRMTAAAKAAAAAVAAIGVAAAASIGRKVFQSYSSFEASMSRVKALSGATQSELKSLSTTAQKLGATTQFSATQSAEAMQFFALAGFKTNEIIKSMRPTLALAAAGQLEISEAADIAAKTMAGMGLSADDLSGVVDVMAKAMITANTDLVQLGEALGVVGPLGRAVGKDVAELTATIQAMSNAGIQGEKAGTALRNILIRITDASSPATAELKRIGVAVADDAGKVRSLSAIIGDLAIATASMTDIQKASTLSTIGGARAVAALSVLVAKGGKELGKMEDALRDAGRTAQRVADEQIDNLRGDIIKLQSAMEGLFITTGKGNAGPARDLIQNLTELTSKLNEVQQAAEIKGGENLLRSAYLDEILRRVLPVQSRVAKFFGISFVDHDIKNAERLANSTEAITANLKKLRDAASKVNEERAEELRLSDASKKAEQEAQRASRSGTARRFSGRVALLKSFGIDTTGLRMEDGQIKGQRDSFDLGGKFIGALQTLKRDLSEPVASLTDRLIGATFGPKTDSPTGPQFAGALQRGSTAEFSARIAALGRGGGKDQIAKKTEQNTSKTAKGINDLIAVIRDSGLSGEQAAVVSI